MTHLQAFQHGCALLRLALLRLALVRLAAASVGLGLALSLASGAHADVPPAVGGVSLEPVDFRAQIPVGQGRSVVDEVLGSGGMPGIGDRKLTRDPALVFDDTIVTISARTQDFNGQAVVPRYRHIRRSRGSRQLNVDQFLLRGVIAINEDTTVSVVLPIVRKSLREPDPAGGRRRQIETGGLGDILVMGKRQLYKKFGPARATVASALLGVELPTGSTSHRLAGVRLPRPLQPGSGSWDVLAGGAFTHVDGRWLVNADAVFKLNTEADGFRFGNELRLDVGAQYRWIPAKYKSFDDTTVNLIAELNARYAGQSRAGGATLANSGGWKVFFTPGIQVIVSENLLFEGAVLVPVFQDLRGTQLEDDFALILGLRALF